MLKVGPKHGSLLAAVLLVTPLIAVVTPPQGASVFRAGARLVEVEVVVRGNPAPPSGFREALKSALDSGPPFGPPGAMVTGLAKDDFQLFDEGHAAPIAVFRAGPSNDAASARLPPGATSNRQDSRGQPLNVATAVLIDFLNTPWESTDYARLGMTRLLHSLAEADSRTAVYSLGKNLHILKDFTEDPQKLMEAAAKPDQPHSELPPYLASALRDYGDLPTAPQSAAGVHPQMTVAALKLIIQHLSGVPGRKNLVWLMARPRVPPAVASMLLQANIVLYPVAIRSVGSFDVAFETLENEHATQDLAAATGGRAFYDAMDLTLAVRASEEDSSTHYLLGYYPAEDALDGKYHRIVVKLRNAKLAGAYEVRYRTGYFATKVAVPLPPPTLQELFEGPVDATGIGLAAQAKPDADHPGLYDVSVTVDLHDIHLDSKDGHFTGAFDLYIPNPSTKHSVKTAIVPVDLTEEQLADALGNGLTGGVTGVESESGEIRVVVRVRATGVARIGAYSSPEALSVALP
jgi:VWFA-related protein